MFECEDCICNKCDYGYCKKSICSIHKLNRKNKVFNSAFPIESCEDFIDRDWSIFIRFKKYIENRFFKKDFDI